MLKLPPIADQEAASRLVDSFGAVEDHALKALLACLGGNSAYLSELALRERQTMLELVGLGPDAVCDMALSRLAALDAASPRAAIAAGLRTAKRQVALAVAVADLTQDWTLAQVTGALSDLAETALRVAMGHLLRAAHDRGELRLRHPQAPQKGSGVVVLAAGKLGARELNYSSDIDLILLFDPEAHAYSADALGAIFARLTRDLVTLMQARDAGGYVFRVDLRLRPDPGSTPPAIALPAALAYYEGQAQTWERAALIKVRPVAGDLALGRRFLESVRPFVWRRHLDFAAIADIRAMKRRVDVHRGTALKQAPDPVARLLGHDVKLGQGGIREIEFSAQTLQLVWGGRFPALRLSGTVAALAALAQAGHLPEGSARDLTEAYGFLRQVEHRLQMVADRQTHALPQTAENFAAFATFMDCAGPAALAATLIAHLDRVHTVFSGLFVEPADIPDLAPGRTPEHPAAPAEQAAESPVWEGWLAGRPRALRSERARGMLLELMPAITAVIERQPEPDTAWRRLDEFFHRLPAGVQILSMVRHNPPLLDRLGDVLGAAPSLADHLASVPSALEGLLAPHEIDPDPAASLAAQLHGVSGVDESLAIATRYVRGEGFRLAVAELDGRIDVDLAAEARTALAEAAIVSLLPPVLRDHARRFGRLPGGGMAVVAMGKAGSRELLFGSDLDLMLIYSPAEGDSMGARPMAASQYFARLAQGIVAALTSPTRDGPLYEVDMRLRPSGRHGPVAVSLAAFEKYHREQAWTWERLALTRARVVAGPAKLQRRVRRAIGEALRQGDPGAAASDTAAMRARLLRDLPPRSPWDVKLRPGGLIEVEFIAQALQLVHARKTAVLHPTTRVAFARLASAGLLDPPDAALLIEADRLWRSGQGLLRIMLGRAIPDTLPQPAITKLSHVLDLPPDRAGIENRLDTLATDVRTAFTRYVGKVGPG